jgi:cell division protein FtsZ
MENEIMTSFEMPSEEGAIIKVIGVGGGGSNAVNHMYRKGIKDVDFIICNTDAQALANSPVPTRVHLGASLTEGRGAGNKPEIGREAAKESIDEVKLAIGAQTKMVFVTAGMGGGTGTGAGPEIAKACREMNLLTIGIVTIPFRNEGKRRIHQAIEGIKELEGHVDSLLVINNEKIREMYGDLKISEAFAKADDVLTTAAKGIAEIITVHGYINVDFADVETVMRQSGVSIMGSATASGETRAIEAVKSALNSPLLNNNNIKGARNILLNVTSGSTEVTMDEIGQIVDYVQDCAGYDADLIWGNGVDESLGQDIAVTIIATGFSTSSIPEVLATQKEEREVHTLIDNSNLGFGSMRQNQQQPQRPAQKPQAAPQKPAANQATISFDQNRPQSVYDAMYSGVRKSKPVVEEEDKPVVREFVFNEDFSHSADSVIEEIESVPAYARKKINMRDRENGDQRKVSRFSLNIDGNNDIFFSENNSYLHDKVD